MSSSEQSNLSEVRVTDRFDLTDRDFLITGDGRGIDCYATFERFYLPKLPSISNTEGRSVSSPLNTAVENDPETSECNLYHDNGCRKLRQN